MLPFDQKRKQVAPATDGVDLVSSAKMSAAKRLMEALSANDSAQAADALEAFFNLCESYD